MKYLILINGVRRSGKDYTADLMKEILGKKLSYVSNGAKTINHETNVHALLIDKLKYRKAYCKLNIEYSTKVNVLITLLYPFRNLINKIKNSKFKALYSLLLQEEIKRSYE